jgi:uncharacterized protein
MTHRGGVPAALIVAMAIAACASSPTTNLYTLGSDLAPFPAVREVGLVIALSPVSVPEVIDRPQIVTRTGPNQVAVDDFERWAEPIKRQIPRVVAAHLTRLLHGAYVYVYPDSASVEADCTVGMDVQSFDSALGEAASAEIVWTVACPKRGLSRSGRTVTREPTMGTGYAALVAAHERGVATVSRDIAEALRGASADDPTRNSY